MNNRQPLISTLYIVLLVCLLPTTPVTAQAPPRDRRFGAVEAFRDPVAATEAGVGWERILFYWSELQHEGPNEWNGYHVPDDWLAQAAVGGREVVGVLKHTPAWATDGLPGCGVPRGLNLPVDDPGNTWAIFVRRVVGIYAGRIDHWVIWNEPDIAPDSFGAEWCGTVEEYYQLLKVAYLAAHQVNPNVVIHLAGLTYYHDTQFGREYYLKRLLAVAVNDPTGAEHGYYFDIVSLHIYFEIQNFAIVFKDTRNALAAYGLQKPIWVNETDAPPNDDPYYPLPEANFQISMEEQASFLLQAFSLALSEGAERIAVYKWVVADPPLPGAEPNGIVRADRSRRPAFEAYKLITTHYAGTVSAQADNQPLYTLVTLDRGGLVTYVFWARTRAEATLSIPAWSDQARLIDQTGLERMIEPAGGQYTMTLPGARCADKRGCIIGGPTYLLVEENNGTPTPTELPTIASPLETPAPPPTDTPTPTLTSTPTLTPTLTPITLTPTPTLTPTLAPSATSTPFPTPTPLPPVPPTPSTPAWPLLIGLAVVLLIAAVLGTMFRYQS